MATEQKYTPELTSQLLAAYAEARQRTEHPDTAALAMQFARSERSVIAKLVKEGVYVAKPKAESKSKTKAEICKQVAEALGLDEGAFDTLEKASKEQLTALLDAVKARTHADE